MCVGTSGGATSVCNTVCRCYIQSDMYIVMRICVCALCRASQFSDSVCDAVKL